MPNITATPIEFDQHLMWFTEVGSKNNLLAPLPVPPLTNFDNMGRNSAENFRREY
jgi:hypothetical protein